MARLIQPAFAKGEIAPQLYGRVDTAMYRVGLRQAGNCIIHTFGGVSNRPGTVYIGPVKNHAEENMRLIPFEFNTTDKYMLEFGDQYMRVIRNDGHVLNNPVAISGITNANPGVVTTSVAHGYTNGTEVFFANIGGMTELNNQRVVVQNVTATTFEITSQFTGANVDTINFGVYTSGGTVASIFELATPYVSADLPTLKYVQSADTMTLVQPNYEPRDLTRVADNVWNLDVIVFTPDQAAPTGVIVTPAVPAAIQYDYRVTAINADTFEESLPADGQTLTGGTPIDNTISWTAAVGNVIRYNIYRLDNGTYGFIGSSEALSFRDQNIVPEPDLTPPNLKDPFVGANNQPGAVTYYQQRQVYGRTFNQPDTIFASKTGSRKNFGVSFPIQDDDAITSTLASAQVNEIRHLTPGKDMFVFTSGAEWRVNSGGDAAFSPNTINLEPQSEWGSSHLRPIKVNEQYLFAENGNARVRNIGYAIQIDGYTGTNLNLLATHLLAEDAPNEYIMRDWSFQYFPEPRLHAVRTDGVLLTMTYDQEQEVVAWTTWETQGDFEATAALRRELSSVEDAVYFVVKRLVNGETVRFIERLHTRKFADVRDAFFLDAGSTVDNPEQIVSFSTSGDLIVTTSAPHNLQVGDIVEFNEIDWVPESVDEFGNPTFPDFLNGRRFEVAVIVSPTQFKLSGQEIT